jgi:quaternary ammonium compound-resistance protein SugE
MNWILLIVAGLFEVAFAACLGKARETAGIEATYWYVGFLACLAISMFLLVRVTQVLPIGTAYAVWTGIGTVGTVLLGILIFKEPATFWRLFCIHPTLVGWIRFRLFISCFNIININKHFVTFFKESTVCCDNTTTAKSKISILLFSPASGLEVYIAPPIFEVMPFPSRKNVFPKLLSANTCAFEIQ